MARGRTHQTKIRQAGFGLIGENRIETLRRCWRVFYCTKAHPEHPTSNAEHRSIRATVVHSMLDVRCFKFTSSPAMIIYPLKMKVRFILFQLALLAGLMLLIMPRANAFALLGPFEPWMTATNGFYPSGGDIGGPMSLGNEYRWNVPVVTYGFDPSFIKFFGSNGVTAVQSAIQILNDLPPASQIVLNDFPPDTQRFNHVAQSEALSDLKSETLLLLLEQLGLASPSRFVFVLKRWDPIFVIGGFYSPPLGGYEFFQINWTDDIIQNNLTQRNYDPATLEISQFVNSTFYNGMIVTFLTGNSSVEVIPVDPSGYSFSAVADGQLNPGGYFVGFTYDDAGGLAYLYSTNNVNYETLLPGIVGAGTNANMIVNGAWRPGVNKITFVPHATNPQGEFIPVTNYFTDSYITNGALMQQQVARIVSKPDFVFSAEDLETSYPMSAIIRTGTTNWLNNAALNGNTNGAGPGIIQPPIHFTFHKFGNIYNSWSEQEINDFSAKWASFDDSTNAPFIYPGIQSLTNEMTFHLWLLFSGGSAPKSLDWKFTAATGSKYSLQTSTNLTDWLTLFSLTNNGAVSTYFNQNPLSAARFYRMVPQ